MCILNNVFFLFFYFFYYTSEKCSASIGFKEGGPNFSEQTDSREKDDQTRKGRYACENIKEIYLFSYPISSFSQCCCDGCINTTFFHTCFYIKFENNDIDDIILQYCSKKKKKKYKFYDKRIFWYSLEEQGLHFWRNDNFEDYNEHVEKKYDNRNVDIDLRNFSINLKFPDELTLKGLIEKSEKNTKNKWIGDNYKLLWNNCHDFVISAIEENNLYPESLEKENRYFFPSSVYKALETQRIKNVKRKIQ